MKTIAIATFLYTNYGALLQGYALQQYLRSNTNCNIININFRTNEHDLEARVFNLYGSFKSRVSQILFTLIRLKGLAQRKHRTEKFKRDYFNLTAVYPTVESFVKNPPCADVYVTGSDQVFNPFGKYKDVFFLNFNKNNARKVAYAASFGVSEYTDEVTRDISHYVRDFDALSCREIEGVDYLNQIADKQVFWVLDPTFLLTDIEWTAVAIAPKIKEKYILVYALAEERKLIDIAKKIKSVTGYQIVCVRYNTRDFINIDKFVYGCGPSELLGLIQNAEAVVTDSFHGTVFSVIFDKKFYSYISRPKYAVRIYNLISLVDAWDRVVDSSNFEIFNPRTELKTIRKHDLNRKIDDSKKFIREEIACED
jgi:hypothetical protein